MASIFRWVSGVILCVASMGAAEREKRAFSAMERAQGYTEATVLALPKAGVGSARSLADGESTARVRTLKHFPRFDGLRVIAVPAGERADSYIKRLEATGLYEWVEKDRLLYAHAIPSDPEFTSGAQWALRNTGQLNGKAGADIQAVAAWDVVSDASTVVVAVIDSGVTWDHPDLAANMWRNPGESGNGRENNGIDDDGNGYIDDVFGINATIPKSQPGAGSPVDDDGHGTAVAGVVGAVGNNGLGVTGVAWKAKIMALKFLTSDGTGATSDAIECMDYAVAMGAKIINASYGSSTFSQAESAAMQRIKNAGLIMVTSSGNEGLNNDEIGHYPSNYTFENLVAVGSSTRTDQPATSSNFGSGKVDLYAPGAEIRVLARNPEAPYTVLSGTSFAAPHVAGALALIKSLYPQDTPRESIHRLLRGVDRVDAFIGKAQSSGRLNLARALASTATPFNDQFSESALLAGGFVSVRTTNDGASREAGELAHAGVSSARSLWWSWTAPETTWITLDTHGSLIDTTLAVYTGTQLAGLVEVIANDNEGGRPTSGLAFTAVKGTTYHFAVDGRGGQQGMILLNLRTPPANDAFQAAREVSGPSFRVTQSNIGATRQPGEPRVENISEGLLGRSVWFRWTAPVEGQFQAAVFSDFVDTVLGVYQGQTVAELTLVAENDDGQNLLYDPLVTFRAKAGETYYFAVDSLRDPGQFDFWLVDSEWQKLTDGAVDSPPSVGPDGMIYFSNSGSDLEAVRANGQGVWVSPLWAAGTYSAPAVAADGTVYVGDESGMLTSVSPSGTSVWRRDLGDYLYGSPALAMDGTVYARAENGALYSLTAKNEVRWTVPMENYSYSSPSIGVDGTLFIGSTDHKLYAFNPDKSIRWTFDAGDELFASPTIDAAGVVYVGALSGEFFAVDPDGRQKWVFRAGGGISSSAAIGSDGTLYFGAYDGKLYAVNANGSLKWATAVGTDIRTSSPAVDDQGVIYIGTLDGTLVAVQADGAIKRTYYFGAPVRSSPVLYGGMLYIGAQDYRLYAIRTQTGPAASPWPMFRKNAARTGAYPVGAPVVTQQPRSQRVLTDGSITLTVQGAGSSVFTYQWFKDGVLIPGATAATLTLTSVQLAQAGIYTVTMQNAFGMVTSDGAMVIVESELPQTGNAARLVNLSVRSVAGQGERTLIVGFIVEGGAKTLLSRAIGPALAQYQVLGYIPDPSMDFVRNGQVVGRNDDWLAEDQPRFDSAGAFPLERGSKDAAMVTPVFPGAYTTQVATKALGVALVELYDLDGGIASGGPRLVNVSARAEVGTGGNVLIAGFVVAGNGTKRVLIRAVGPQLAEFKLGGVLNDPHLDLYHNGAVIASNDNWSGDDGRGRGAFPLNSGSKDSVLILELAPGSYTANVSGVGATTGVALVEVYEW